MNNRKLKIKDVLEIRDYYGGKTTLDQVVKHIQGDRIHKCPKCNGSGYTVVEYNKYPSGLPDSGWVYEPGYKNVKCDLCDGEGYTEHKYKPKMIQDGWELK